MEYETARQGNESQPHSAASGSTDRDAEWTTLRLSSTRCDSTDVKHKMGKPVSWWIQGSGDTGDGQGLVCIWPSRIPLSFIPCSNWKTDIFLRIGRGKKLMDFWERERLYRRYPRCQMSVVLLVCWFYINLPISTLKSEWLYILKYFR